MAAPKRYHSLLIKVFLFVTLWNAPFCSSSATHHTVQVSALLPSSSCNHITATNQVDSESSSLKVVHRHGPCSSLGLNQASKPSHKQILAQDQSRVQSIQARISVKQGTNGIKGSKADLPAKPGSIVGAGNYIVNVGLGTPKKDLSLIFDTGSDLTWTQCRPCAKYCYKQQDPVLDPSMSTSYTNISCTSALCSQLTSATGNTPGCSASTCVYGIQYGDSSFSVGFFGKEKLTLTPTETFSGIMFGCGQNNRGLFGRAAGLLGLGRDKISIVEQTAAKYGRYFSYCLPSSPSSTGHLTFGKTATPKSTSNAISFTPMSTISQGSSFYGIRISGITVGGTKVPIPSTVFSNAPQIIDSGTVITRLPPTAYTALRDAFKKSMTKYPTAPALSILDTCYDFSKYSSVDIPKITLSFAGPTTVDLDPSGILYPASASQVCLAFAPNSDDTDVLIYGNVQQQTFTVVYDIAGLKIGFAPNGCS